MIYYLETIGTNHDKKTHITLSRVMKEDRSEDVINSGLIDGRQKMNVLPIEAKLYRRNRKIKVNGT